METKYEIFVVDNNSNDGTAEFVKKEFPQINLIANKDNPGFAKANNQAIAKARGKYVLLLNPDTIVLPDSIDKMLKFMDANGGVGAIGPKIFAEDMCTVSSCAARKFPSILLVFLGLAKLNFLLKHQDINRGGDTDSLSGACMMVRKEAIDAVGMLDEDFFMYAEDIDWCYRIKRSGRTVFYLPEAAIVHYGERSAVKKFSEIENMTENFQAYYKYFNKHYGKLYALCFRLMLGFTMAGWNLFWTIRFVGSIKGKKNIRQIIARNNKFIEWSINAKKHSYMHYIL
jgi:hypothetical protein